MPFLADQVDDTPAAVALLDVFERQPDGFVAPQAAADQHRQDRPVPLALVGRRIRSGEQRLGLALGQPVAGADAVLLGAADVPDGLRRGRIEQPVVRRFRRQFPHGREFLIHAGRREPLRFERRPPGLHRGAGERRPTLSGPPAEEIVERPGVHDAGERARDGVEHQLLDRGERIRAAVAGESAGSAAGASAGGPSTAVFTAANSTSAAPAAAAALRRSPSRVASGRPSRIASSR